MASPRLGTFQLGTIRLASTAPAQSTTVSNLAGLVSPKSLGGLDTPSVKFGLISPTEKAGKS